MIRIWIVSSLTLSASTKSGFFFSVTDASCFHDASVNGPSVTMCDGSVHFSPNVSTAFWLTGMNDVCESCCRNHGCGDVRVIFTVDSSGAVMPTLFFNVSHCWFAALGLQELYSCAPWIP